MVPQGVSHCLRIGQDGPSGMLPPPLDWKCDLEAAAEPATVLLMAWYHCFGISDCCNDVL